MRLDIDAGRKRGHALPLAAGDGRALSAKLTVAEVQGGRVELNVERAAACSSCAVQKGCAPAALVSLSPFHTVEMAHPEALEITKGDEVVVSMPADQFLTAAGLAYLLPPVTLTTAALGFGAAGLSDLTVAALAVPVFALSFWPLYAAERRGRVAQSMTIEAVAHQPSAEQA